MPYSLRISVAERVLDRLLGAEFDDSNLRTLVRPLEPDRPDRAEVHCMLSKPSLAIVRDREHPGTNALVTIPYLSGRVFWPEPPDPPLRLDAFECSVWIFVALRQEGDRIRCALSEVVDDDVVVGVMDVAPDESEEFWRERLPPALQVVIGRALRDGALAEFERFALPLDLDPDWLTTEGAEFAIDVQVLEETRDREARVDVGVYETRDVRFEGRTLPGIVVEETRGDPGAIGPVLDDGRSLGLAMGERLVSHLVRQGVDDSFMRFDVTVTRTEHVEHGVIVSAQSEEEHPRVTLTSDRDRHPERVHGRVTNLQTTASATFETTSHGALRETSIGAVAGQTLRFEGSYSVESADAAGLDLVIYPPTWELSPGRIDVQGDAFLRGWVIDLFRIGVNGAITLSIDQATGAITPHVRADVALPGLVELALMLIATPICYVFLKDRVTRRGRERLHEELTEGAGDLMPELGDERTWPFLERVDVTREQIAVIGHLEAGRIRRAGWSPLRGDVTPPPGVHLDVRTEGVVTQAPPPEEATYCAGPDGPCDVRHSTTTWPRLTFTVRQDAADGSATVLCTAGEGSPPSLADLGIPGSPSFFDDLSADRIDRLSFTEGHNFLECSSIDALWGRVFAVRSPWGSLAKVRTDPLDRDRLVVRGVTCERPPRPRVDMLGDWHTDERPGTYGGALVREVTGADHYWVDLRARRHLLHDVPPNAPARYDWEKLDGPGTLVPDPSHPGDPARVRLVVDTTRFGDDASPFVGPAFRTTVQVTVEDVFGQRAGAVREFRGSRRVETTRGPRRDYDPLPGGRPPMDPAPDDVRLRRGIMEALLRGYSVRRGAEEEEAEQAGAERRTGVEEAVRRG